MSSDKTFGVRIGLEKGKLRVESDNPDLGAAREEIDVPYKGTPVQIGFNARYFIDLLGEIETPEVRAGAGRRAGSRRGAPGRRQRLCLRRHADAALNASGPPPCASASFRRQGWRNLQPLTLLPGERLTVLYGDNGQGKTNVLEAAYYLAALRSFRTTHWDD